MVFPAGILQAAVLQPRRRHPGQPRRHRRRHGPRCSPTAFDDQGAQYDAAATSSTGGQPETSSSSSSAPAAVVDQYATYEVTGAPTSRANTVGENIATSAASSSRSAAYRACGPRPPTTVIADGFTEDQQFSSAWQAWLRKAAPTTSASSP